jgi:hypothetical protein
MSAPSMTTAITTARMGAHQSVIACQKATSGSRSIGVKS